jgi:hypothetical protein
VIRITPDMARDIIIAAKDGDAERVLHLAATLEELLMRPQHGSDVMDTIASVINKRMARQIISGSTLAQLRAALMSPRELEKFRLQAKKGLCCANCASPFEEEEMGIIYGGSVMCRKCINPRVFSCSGGHKLVMPKGAITSMDRVKKNCPECVKEKEKEITTEDLVNFAAPPPPPAADPTRAPTLEEYREGRTAQRINARHNETIATAQPTTAQTTWMTNADVNHTFVNYIVQTPITIQEPTTYHNPVLEQAEELNIEDDDMDNDRNENEDGDN